MKLPRFWNSDKLLSVSAILISFATFATLIYQTRLLQKQQFASAMPYLALYYSMPYDSTFTLLLENNGTGPAFINEIKIHYQGKVYSTDPPRFYKSTILPKDTIYFGYSNINKGRVLPAGEQISLVENTRSLKDAAKLKRLFGEEGTAKLEIIYSSVYEEQWRIIGLTTAPEKLED